MELGDRIDPGRDVVAAGGGRLDSEGHHLSFRRSRSAGRHFGADDRDRRDGSERVGRRHARRRGDLRDIRRGRLRWDETCSDRHVLQPCRDLLLGGLDEGLFHLFGDFHAELSEGFRTTSHLQEALPDC